MKAKKKRLKKKKEGGEHQEQIDREREQKQQDEDARHNFNHISYHIECKCTKPPDLKVYTVKLNNKKGKTVCCCQEMNFKYKTKNRLKVKG